jgi:hypothetical protein
MVDYTVDVDIVKALRRAAVPDDDRFPKSLSARWRRVQKAFQAGESDEMIQYHVASATAETLRTVRGIPALAQLGARLHEAVSADKAASNDPFSLPSHVPTRLARRAVAVLAADLKGRLALTSPEQATLILAERVVADVAYSYGLDRMAPGLVKAGHDHVELLDRYRGLTQSNLLGELARRLLAHPDGTGLRAPSRRRPKIGTSDLLNVDIADLP